MRKSLDLYIWRQPQLTGKQHSQPYTELSEDEMSMSHALPKPDLEQKSKLVTCS